jgi:hypothetical protein
MGWRITGFPVALALMLGSAELASAGPFDRPLKTYGLVINEILRQAGSDLRFQLDRCSTAHQAVCRFSSLHVAVVVEGQKGPASISRIVIATDLLRDHPTTPPHVAVIDTLITLTATMMIFDPDLPDDQRDGLVSTLAEAAHSAGQGEGSGIAADYVIALEQNVTTLLVIAMAPKPSLR